MKYSLRSLMVVILVAPPLLAWAALPLYRWLTFPAVKEPGIATQTNGPPFTFYLGPVKVLRMGGNTPIVDLDFEFHQKPGP